MLFQCGLSLLHNWLVMAGGGEVEKQKCNMTMNRGSAEETLLLAGNVKFHIGWSASHVSNIS